MRVGRSRPPWQSLKHPMGLICTDGGGGAYAPLALYAFVAATSAAREAAVVLAGTEICHATELLTGISVLVLQVVSLHLCKFLYSLQYLLALVHLHVLASWVHLHLHLVIHLVSVLQTLTCLMPFLHAVVQVVFVSHLVRRRRW